MRPKWQQPRPTHPRIPSTPQLTLISATTTPRPHASAPQPAPAQTDTQLASTIAGVTSRLLLHPIDSIKTRLQRLRGRRGTISASRFVADFIATEGLPGLYRGILGALAGVLPYSMLYMPSYELAQMQLGKHLGGKELLGMRHVAAGSVAGLCGSLVKVPVDVVKKRLQAGLYPNIFVAIASIAAERGDGAMALLGIRRFYSGWRSSIFYDVPYNAVQFTVLENVKRAMRSVRRRDRLGRADHVVVGALTGMITSVITEPLDVVKTRMMTQKVRIASTTTTSQTIYKGWVHCMHTIIREEGPAALWKGTLPRLVWVGASSAIWYGTYQAVRQNMSARRGRDPKIAKNIPAN